MVQDSDHMIPFERPDAIVAAIHEVYTAANVGSAPNNAAKPSETVSPAHVDANPHRML
jgi:hypothetical protein